MLLLLLVPLYLVVMIYVICSAFSMRPVRIKENNAGRAKCTCSIVNLLYEIDIITYFTNDETKASCRINSHKVLQLEDCRFKTQFPFY